MPDDATTIRLFDAIDRLKERQSEAGTLIATTRLIAQTNKEEILKLRGLAMHAIRGTILIGIGLLIELFLRYSG